MILLPTHLHARDPAPDALLTVLDDGTPVRLWGWVIGRGGRIIHKSDWTSAANVEAFLTRYEDGRARRPQPGNVGPYLTELVEFRDIDREDFYQRLGRNGPRASTNSSQPMRSGEPALTRILGPQDLERQPDPQ